jgi:hypothetical protein
MHACTGEHHKILLCGVEKVGNSLADDSSKEVNSNHLHVVTSSRDVLQTAQAHVLGEVSV